VIFQSRGIGKMKFLENYKNYQIYSFDSEQEPGSFYVFLRDIFISSQIRKELGMRIYDDSDKIWFAALDQEMTVAGFCAIKIYKNKAVLQHSYVFPKYRMQGIYKTLFQIRLEYLQNNQNIKKIESTLTHTAFNIRLWEGHGFFVTGNRGQYIVVSKQNESFLCS